MAYTFAWSENDQLSVEQLMFVIVHDTFIDQFMYLDTIALWPIGFCHWIYLILFTHHECCRQNC